MDVMEEEEEEEEVEGRTDWRLRSATVGSFA